ncbi:hypothetical protein AAT19DRAFT_11905 [Rhodotorula toruloides]|uniref:Uncharacterized protein n=1 Tax=Rhodotorula toruloides TaxID=5286 RepID=A0A2T0AEQ8_RHOTO|nr:hypothetical protein AAT19DRAFT_11905 [Rhodotorula toruloides]
MACGLQCARESRWVCVRGHMRVSSASLVERRFARRARRAVVRPTQRFPRLRRRRRASRCIWPGHSERLLVEGRRGRGWRARNLVGGGQTCGVRTASAGRFRRGMLVAWRVRGRSSASVRSPGGQHSGTGSVARWGGEGAFTAARTACACSSELCTRCCVHSVRARPRNQAVRSPLEPRVPFDKSSPSAHTARWRDAVRTMSSGSPMLVNTRARRPARFVVCRDERVERRRRREVRRRRARFGGSSGKRERRTEPASRLARPRKQSERVVRC